MKTPLNNINWFPGHMKKATDEILQQLSHVDLVIEVVDARGMRVSSNPELQSIIQHKPVLKIGLKADLCDLNSNNETPNELIGSIKDTKFKQIIIKKIYSILQPKIDKLQAKGLVKFNFIIMVVGIPNVGKSSLINLLAAKKIMRVENRAGVTKRQNIRKINDHLFLIDTPGILIKKIETPEDAYQLALLNCIKHDVLVMDDIIEYAFNYFNQHYSRAWQQYFKTTFNDYPSFIQTLCEQYGFKSKDNTLDTTRAYEWLFKLISNSEITRYHFL